MTLLVLRATSAFFLCEQIIFISFQKKTIKSFSECKQTSPILRYRGDFDDRYDLSTSRWSIKVAEEPFFDCNTIHQCPRETRTPCSSNDRPVDFLSINDTLRRRITGFRSQTMLFLLLSMQLEPFFHLSTKWSPTISSDLYRSYLSIRYSITFFEALNHRVVDRNRWISSICEGKSRDNLSRR